MIYSAVRDVVIYEMVRYKYSKITKYGVMEDVVKYEV